MYPVVAQHSLQSFIHSKPKDRRDAICAAFGLDELTTLKTSLDSARFQRTPPGAVGTARLELGANAAELAKIPATAALSGRWRQNPMLAGPTDLQELLQAATDITRKECPTPEVAIEALREAHRQTGRMVFDVDPLVPADNLAASIAAYNDKMAVLNTAVTNVERAIAAVAASMTATYSALILDFWKTGLELAPAGDVCPMCEALTLDNDRRQELRRRLAAGATVVTSKAALAVAVQAAKVANGAHRIATRALGVAGLSEEAKVRLRSLFAGTPTLVEIFIDAHDRLLDARTALLDAQAAIDTFISGCGAHLTDR